MSGEQECRKCDGERTHPMTDAMPCDWCGGSGVEPMNAPQSDTDPKEFVPSGCDCGNCDKPSGTDPTSDPIGGASSGHDELVERLTVMDRLLVMQRRVDWRGSEVELRNLLTDAFHALAAAGTAPTPPEVQALQAFKRDGAWPWIANENMFAIVVHDAEGGYLTDLSVPTEELAETVLALLNRRSPTPPTVSADLLERIRERTVSSALEGADPLMVDLYAALTATPTAPAVDVTDYAVVADDGWRDGGYQTETEAIEAAIAYNAPPATEQHHVVEVGTVERQVWPVRAQGVPSTDPSGGA